MFQAAAYLRHGFSLARASEAEKRFSDREGNPSALRGKFKSLARGGGLDETVTVSVVIPVHYREGVRRVAAAMASLAENRTDAKVQVLLVVNGKAGVDALAASPAASFAGEAGVEVMFRSYTEDGPESPERPMNIFIPRQVGLEAARGSIVMQGDIDNLFSPGWIESYVLFFKAHPHIPAAYGPVAYYGMRGVSGRLMALTGTFAKAAKILIGYPPCAGHNHALRRSAALSVRSLYSGRIRVHENEIPKVFQREFGKARVDEVVGFCPGSKVATRFGKADQSFRGAARWFLESVRRNLRQIRRMKRLML